MAYSLNYKALYRKFYFLFFQLLIIFICFRTAHYLNQECFMPCSQVRVCRFETPLDPHKRVGLVAMHMCSVVESGLWSFRNSENPLDVPGFYLVTIKPKLLKATNNPHFPCFLYRNRRYGNLAFGRLSRSYVCILGLGLKRLVYVHEHVVLMYCFMDVA